jgi:hypothetical protein
MVAVVSLYQDWLPFLLGIGYVVIHHGFIGWLFPADVFNHPAANKPALGVGIDPCHVHLRRKHRLADCLAAATLFEASRRERGLSSCRP